MSRRNAVRIVSFSICIAVFSLISVFKVKTENKKYMLHIENSYSYLFDELNTAANNISVLLNKARFVTTKERIGSIASSLLTEAEISKSALSQLPVAEQLSTLNLFFSQVGSYAMSVSEELDKGTISTQTTANIELLSDIGKRVSDALDSSRDNYNNLEYWASQLENSLQDTVNIKTLGSYLGELEETLTDYPTLIYDGPYSDHILKKEPAMLVDTATVSQEEALKTATVWSNSPPSFLEFAGTTNGKIPTLDFWGEGVCVSVTQKGGYVLYFRKEVNEQEIILNYEQALLKANAFLESKGMTNLKETYYFQSDGVCTVNFAYKDGKTLCYTDLIKVGVSMESGDIVFYEAGGYIANHKERAFEVPQITEEEAASIISPKLSVNSIQLALIPTDSIEEKRCYEFACTSADGQEVLVYINTATLSEEDILILQKSDGGILVK